MCSVTSDALKRCPDILIGTFNGARTRIVQELQELCHLRSFQTRSQQFFVILIDYIILEKKNISVLTKASLELTVVLSQKCLF